MCGFKFYFQVWRKGKHTWLSKPLGLGRKTFRLGRWKEAPLIPRLCVKWPGLLVVIAPPQISVKKKNNKPHTLNWQIDREHVGRDHQVPRCVKERPMDARNLGQHPQSHQQRSGYVVVRLVHFCSTETGDDIFEAFPLVFTAQQLANVWECNVSSSSLNNYDPRAPQMSDTLQSISISQTSLEQEIQEMNAILPNVLKTLE